MLIFAWISLMVLFAFPAMSLAEGPVIGSACSFTWVAPTTRTDGSPLTRPLKEHRLYTLPTKGAYALKTPLGSPIAAPATSTTCEVQGVNQDGQYYVVVTAVDADGRESGPSTEVDFFRDTTTPSPPTMFNITLTLQGTIQLQPVPAP